MTTRIWKAELKKLVSKGYIFFNILERKKKTIVMDNRSVLELGLSMALKE